MEQWNGVNMIHHPLAPSVEIWTDASAHLAVGHYAQLFPGGFSSHGEVQRLVGTWTEAVVLHGWNCYQL